jgi:hypothetical protein
MQGVCFSSTGAVCGSADRPTHKLPAPVMPGLKVWVAALVRPCCLTWT